MEQTNHGMTKYTKNEDYLHTDHFNSMVDNIENLYDSDQEIVEKIKDYKELFDNHVANKQNPHEVTAKQIGLGNVDNTADIDKPVSSAQQTAIRDAGDESKNYTDQCMAPLNAHIKDTLIHHSHSNKAVLDTITQEMLDSFGTGGSGSSGASDEIVLGTEINLIKPCKKGFVGMTDYGEKRYGEINRLSYFYMPYPLLYVNEEISEDSANPTFYRQKLISIEDTAFNDGESTIAFTKGELVYLRGTLGSSRRVFTLDYMTPVTQDVMSENDMYYMLLGLATSEKELYLFSEHPIFKTSEGTFCEIGLKTVGLIEGMNFGTIEPTQFRANTDEYKDYYPYYVDLYDNRLKEYSWVEVNYTPATLQLGCMCAQVRIMNGILRLYADEIPSGNIEIDNVFFKEVN